MWQELPINEKKNERNIHEKSCRLQTHHSLAVWFLQLAHLCGHFNSKVDLIWILADDLQLYVLGSSIARIWFLILKQEKQ